MLTGLFLRANVDRKKRAILLRVLLLPEQQKEVIATMLWLKKCFLHLVIR
jgi:hypothetical protein